MMRLRKKRSVSNKLTTYFFGVALITVFMYTNFLIEYFSEGNDNAAQINLLAETRSFANAYKQDKTVPLPSSYVTQFYYDTLPKIEVDHVDLLEGLKLEVGDFELFDTEEGDPDDLFIVVHREELDDGRTVYAVATYDFNLLSDIEMAWWENDLIKLTLYIGVGYLLFILIALWFYSYKIGKKSRALVDWAEHISTATLDEVRPDFRFDEFNRVAACLECSLERNALLMDREKQFLSHASHELRTPIAIIRANMELLGRMIMPESSLSSLSRIERANTNMQLTTETLLWLGRKNETAPAQKKMNLPLMLKQLVDDHKYLIQGEHVDVIYDFQSSDETLLLLPKAPLMIVLNNLIRNAFQYTDHGWIKVRYFEKSVTIENYDTDIVADKNVVSFGLGLELTQKVCDRLNWDLEINYSDGGVTAQLQLPIE